MGVYLVHGYCDTRWLTGPWFSQAIVEGIVPKAIWHWGSNTNVVNDPPLEIQAAPLLHVVLPSAWGSVESHCLFSLRCVGEIVSGDYERYE